MANEATAKVSNSVLFIFSIFSYVSHKWNEDGNIIIIETFPDYYTITDYKVIILVFAVFTPEGYDMLMFQHVDYSEGSVWMVTF